MTLMSFYMLNNLLRITLNSLSDNAHSLDKQKIGSLDNVALDILCQKNETLFTEASVIIALLDQG